jgi:DTW domain-containing protein YfiP
MVKLTTSLHRLPRVSFPSGRVSEFEVKHQPLPGCLSTVESVHQVLKDLIRMGIENTFGAEENLMHVFRYTVKQQLNLAQDPLRTGYRRKPYSPSSKRRSSKKWENRSVFFNSDE